MSAAAIVFSGSTYHTFEKFSQFSGLNFVNNSTFYQIQRNLIIPAINKLYDENIRQARAEIREPNCRVIGDGRFDSPGKSAKYCTYSIQSVKSNKIIASSTLQTEKGKESTPLELAGFINCLRYLTVDKIHVKTITTDRNKQVAKWLRENKPTIDHKYDPWHFSKNVKGALRPIA